MGVGKKKSRQGQGFGTYVHRKLNYAALFFIFLMKNIKMYYVKLNVFCQNMPWKIIFKHINIIIAIIIINNTEM